jgi:hypothetical protein
VHGAKQVYEGPVYVTDDGSGGVREYAEPRPAPPQGGIPD